MPSYLESAGQFNAIACQPSSGWFGESKEKHTPFIEILFEISEGIEKGKFITAYLYLSDKSIDRTIATLTKVFGFSGDLEALEKGSESFHGKPCSLVVENETFENKTRAKVRWINLLHQQREPMAREKVSSLFSKFNGRSKAIAADTVRQMAAEGKTPPPPGRAQPTDEQLANLSPAKPGIDEDVPF